MPVENDVPAVGPTLGTLLRHLIELLDGGVQQSYENAALDYRPRYTPVVRALRKAGACSVRTIAAEAGITHSAASQTVAQMAKDGLVTLASGTDARERIVSATARLDRMLPALERCWTATNAAAADLERELAVPLSAVVGQAIAALERRSFDARIAEHAMWETRAC